MVASRRSTSVFSRLPWLASFSAARRTSAEAEPADLYPDGTETDAFQRAVSRLMEMRSEAYLRSRHAEGRQNRAPLS